MAITRFDRFGLDWRPDLLRRMLDVDFGDAIRVEELHEGNEYVIRAELPGIDPDKDAEITVSDGILHVAAHRSERTEHKGKRGYRSEFRYGEMMRDVALPAGAKEDQISASYRDGILEVRVPIAEEVKPDVKRVLVEHT